jgi:hypothetical protein
MTWTSEDLTTAATVVNAVLVVILVGATIYYARQTKATVDELREARIGEHLPLLQWQTPSAHIHHDRTHTDVPTTRSVWQTVQVVLWNIGPGAARVLAASAMSSDGKTWEWKLGIPSTIPSGNQTEQFIMLGNTPEEFRPELVTLEITVRYADVAERTTYETRIKIAAHYEDAPPAYPPQTVDVPAEFIDSDERSAAERRVPR